MKRGIAIVVVLGALAAVALFRVRQAAGGAAASGSGESARRTERGAEHDRTAASREETALREEMRALDGQIADAKKEHLAAVRADRARRNPWLAAGRKLFLLRGKLRNPAPDDPEMEALRSEVMAAWVRGMKEHDLTDDDFELSPWCLPSELLAVLAASDNAPDAAQQEALDAIMEEAEADWSIVRASRSSLTCLELRRDQYIAMDRTWRRIGGTLNPEQKALLGQFDWIQRSHDRGPVSQTSGTRLVIAENLVRSWARELGIGNDRTESIRPLVAEYMRSFDALELDAPDDPARLTVARMNLMIETQKRIRETLPLDDGQLKKLSGWSTFWGYEIVEEPR